MNHKIYVCLQDNDEECKVILINASETLNELEDANLISTEFWNQCDKITKLLRHYNENKDEITFKEIIKIRQEAHKNYGILPSELFEELEKLSCELEASQSTEIKNKIITLIKENEGKKRIFHDIEFPEEIAKKEIIETKSILDSLSQEEKKNLPLGDFIGLIFAPPPLVKTKKTSPGQGRRLCKNPKCGEYIGVRSVKCEYCNFYQK